MMDYSSLQYKVVAFGQQSGAESAAQYEIDIGVFTTVFACSPQHFPGRVQAGNRSRAHIGEGFCIDASTTAYFQRTLAIDGHNRVDQDSPRRVGLPGSVCIRVLLRMKVDRHANSSVLLHKIARTLQG